MSDPAMGIVTTAPGSGKTVALTFDDGPSSFTPKILAVLRADRVRATFFNTGLRDHQHPKIAAEVVADGHLLADHTWDHQYPSQVQGGWTRSYLSHQMEETNRLQRSISGRAVCFFRNPGGRHAAWLLPTAREHHMSVVMWSVTTQDWKQPAHTSPAFVHRMLRLAAKGLTQAHPVILLHDGKASHSPESLVHSYRGNDLVALSRIIELYRSHGYRFVDMLGRGDLPPDPS